jgi:hypothetical protein
MKTKRSKSAKQQQKNGSLTDVTQALGAVTHEEWRQLARLAECLLRDLRNDPRLARYLAGTCGEELVNAAVAAVQLGAQSPGRGRAVKRQHLAYSGEFLHHMKQIIRSIANNFRRHEASQFLHQPINEKGSDGAPCDPVDPIDLEKNIAFKDLFGVLLPRVLLELQGKPKQLSVLREWARSNGQDAILPAVESKFVRFCVRKAIVRQLRVLAATDLKVRNPSGKELLF